MNENFDNIFSFIILPWTVFMAAYKSSILGNPKKAVHLKIKW